MLELAWALRDQGFRACTNMKQTLNHKAVSPFTEAIKSLHGVWQISLTSFFSTGLTEFPAHIRKGAAKNIRKFWTNVYLFTGFLWASGEFAVSSIITGTMCSESHPQSNLVFHTICRKSKMTSACLSQNNASMCSKHVG